MKLFKARWPGREMTGNGKTENGHFTEPPYYMPHHTINHYISQKHHITLHCKPSRQ